MKARVIKQAERLRVTMNSVITNVFW